MKKISVVFLLSFAFLAPLFAGELEGNGVFPELVIEDQYENEAKFPADAEIIIFAGDKAGADLVNAYLENKPADFLVMHKARFVSDISGMPAMITRMFALPRMRERAYPIYLVRDEQSLAFMPRRKGRVTVMSLSEGRATNIRYVASETDFDKVFNHSAASQQ